MKLSIIIPGIRVNRWEEVYDSIHNSITYPFEVIIISPYALPSSLQSRPNVKYVKDFGSPVRCSNIGLSLAEGELMTWNADDGNFLGHNCIDRAIQAFDAMPPHEKNVLVCKYMEGHKTVQPDSYFKLCNAYPRVVALKNDDWWIFNLVITTTKYFRDTLGGWDCNFQTLAFAHADMALRSYHDGCVTEMFHEPIVYNTHGHTDHVPIEIAHNQFDHPLYISLHNNQDNRKLSVDNWRSAPRVWEQRFGKL